MRLLGRCVRCGRRTRHRTHVCALCQHIAIGEEIRKVDKQDELYDRMQQIVHVDETPK